MVCTGRGSDLRINGAHALVIKLCPSSVEYSSEFRSDDFGHGLGLVRQSYKRLRLKNGLAMFASFCRYEHYRTKRLVSQNVLYEHRVQSRIHFFFFTRRASCRYVYLTGMQIINTFERVLRLFCVCVYLIYYDFRSKRSPTEVNQMSTKRVDFLRFRCTHARTTVVHVLSLCVTNWTSLHRTIRISRISDPTRNVCAHENKTKNRLNESWRETE